MDESIIQYIKRTYNMMIGERTAEQLKMEIGSALPLDRSGRLSKFAAAISLPDLPKTITITSDEVAEALRIRSNAIVERSR